MRLHYTGDPVGAIGPAAMTASKTNMTGSLRSTARNPVAIALMGLLILVFLVLGVGGGGKFPDAFKGARADSIITAGSHVTSANDYRRIFEQQKQRFEQQSKQVVTSEFLIKNGFDQQLLSQIALDDGQLEMLKRAGIVPDATLIDAQIKQIPVAFDRVTGKFSEKQFTEFLARQGLTPQQVQADLTDEMAQRHFGYAVQTGFRAPRAYAAMSAISALQNRDVSYFVLDARAVVQPAPPTDAQLLAFEKTHAAQLTRPEMRAVTLARFSAAALAPAITVSPADIQKEFEFRKDTLSTPETRVVIQIPVKTAAAGAQAAQRLRQGEDPAAVARAVGSEPVIYQDKPKSAISDLKLGAAAFAMKEGQAGGPIQGDLGLAALKVVKTTAGHSASLEQGRAKIEADLKAKAAKNKAYELSQKFDDARQAGANVADAAAKAGVATIMVGPFTSEGLDGQGKPIADLGDKIAKSAFAMHAGEDSDVQDAGAGEYYALKVVKVLPPAMPALDEIRAPLTQAYMREQLVVVLKAKADALIAQITKGATFDAAAASVGAKAARIQGMQLVKAQQYQALGRDFLTQIFGRKSGDLFAAGAPNGVFIARLDAVRPGEISQTAQFLEALEGRASQDYLRDLFAATKAAAGKAIKVNVNLDLARKTMGVDPATMPKPGGKAAGGAK